MRNGLNSSKRNSIKRRKQEKGITLMALAITIVILIILAGIGIGALTGDNGVIKNAENAKENAEIQSERNLVNQSAIKAIKMNRRGNLVQDGFQEAINSNAGENEAKVYDETDRFIVLFKSGRAYTVDKEGNIIDEDKNYKVATRMLLSELEDSSYGTEEKPYEINCIEDLLDFSLKVNGIAISEEGFNYTTSYNAFSGKYITLKRNLNFNSELSYENASRTDYFDVNQDGTTEELIKELTTGKGWIPIGGYGETKNGNGFTGIFKGEDKKITNLYLHVEEEINYGGLFGFVRYGKITNLNVKGHLYSGCRYLGGIVGMLREAESIENCTFDGKVEGTFKGAAGHEGGIGGIIGCFGQSSYSTTIINKCSSKGTIIGYETSDWYNGVGGIFGASGKTVEIRNSFNQATVTAIDGGDAGGIAGKTYAYIENCYNEGKISGVNNIGGITGKVRRKYKKLL